MGIVYKLISPSGKVYIGQTWNLEERLKSYKKKSCKGQKKLFNAILKYKFDSFEIEVLDYCYEQVELDDAEIYWIQYYDSIKNGYNLRSGGSRGLHSEETKKIQSKNNWLKNGKCTEQYRKNMSFACSGNKNGFYGKKHSKETKNKLSKHFTGCKMSKETKNKMSKSQTGRKHSDETIRKKSESNSKFTYEIKYPDGSIIIIKSLRNFCKDNNLSTSALFGVLSGKRKHHKGLTIRKI